MLEELSLRRRPRRRRDQRSDGSNLPVRPESSQKSEALVTEIGILLRSGGDGDHLGKPVAGAIPGSGRRLEDKQQARSGGGILLIRSVYTCGDGSGTFDLLKHLTLRFTETGFTTAGPLEILSGTGAYAAITGHGFGSGESVGAIGGGTETGVVRLP